MKVKLEVSYGVRACTANDSDDDHCYRYDDGDEGDDENDNNDDDAVIKKMMLSILHWATIQQWHYSWIW